MMSVVAPAVLKILVNNAEKTFPRIYYTGTATCVPALLVRLLGLPWTRPTPGESDVRLGDGDAVW